MESPRGETLKQYSETAARLKSPTGENESLYAAGSLTVPTKARQRDIYGVRLVF